MNIGGAEEGRYKVKSPHWQPAGLGTGIKGECLYLLNPSYVNRRGIKTNEQNNENSHTLPAAHAKTAVTDCLPSP